MIEDDNTATPAPTQAELLAVEIGDWAPLGGDVRLELAGRRTVLVGRNGSGKSALLFGIFWGGGVACGQFSAIARQRPDFPSVPMRFLCEHRDAQGEMWAYQYRLGKRIEESAWNQRDAVWVDTDLRRSDRERLVMSFREMNWLLAGIPRHQTFVRGKQVVSVTENVDGGGFRVAYLNQTEPVLGRLAEQLVLAHYSSHEGELAELAELGRRIGAWQTLQVETYRGREEKDSIAAVSIDGVDLGLVADGTQRVTGMLWDLVRSARTTCKLLLVDEPETGVHPGLLAGLLDTIDAYSIDRQVIVSTHSPQVVSWAKPQELRVVTREAGKTQVRPLSEQQVAQFLKYLHDQTLGEFVYSGALDDEG